ncbi:MAG TPA: DNA mismatch repair protein MutL, partial [Rectinemataceae bacterium]|nr:DNA mismatch repair protein MutL [Rectinemataceae bacterium]
PSATRDPSVPARAWATLLRERPSLPPQGGPWGGGVPIGSEGGPDSTGASGEKLRYLGQAFSLFLIVERGDELFLIDQHAAHERLIFDELSKSPPTIQELLVPIAVRVESDEEERRLAALAPAIAESGFSLEEAGGDWQLTALPSSLRGDPEGAIRELIEGGNADPARSARAMTACRSAIKDGEELDPDTAFELARRALDLPEALCPHGRPVWFRLSREELFRLVRRIV